MKLTLTFQDKSSKQIDLVNAIEANHPGKQAIEFRETDKGWILYFTKRTMEGKRIAGINFINPP